MESSKTTMQMEETPKTTMQMEETPKTTMQELLPFIKELLAQRPGRGMLKVYLLGSLLAVLGTAIGLAEAVCHPFTGGDQPLDAEMTLLLTAGEERRRRTLEVEEERRKREEVEECVDGGEEGAAVTDHVTLVKTHEQQAVRSPATRQHAS